MTPFAYLFGIGVIMVFLMEDGKDDVTNRLKFMTGLKMNKVYRP